MRLAAPETLDLDRIAAAVLDRRLAHGSARPLAVALSGGGDSVALLLTAHAWATAAGRKLLVLTVDHRLQPESADWTADCGARAKALGAEFRALAWEGEKPLSGLPAAARAARHRLLADAAREAGAHAILMGHTADDVLEARAMRAAGSTTPEPREWSPSPAWPEGRGLFLLRPLLGVRRAEIRDWLAQRGARWIEDPANLDQSYARSRARQALTILPADEDPPDLRALAAATRMDAAGVLSLPRQDLPPTLVGIACLCAAGTTRPPASDRLARLAKHLAGGEVLSATLAGARIEADGEDVRFLREPGEAARGGLAPLDIAAGETAVWDGRFEIDGPVEVRALAGHAARLPKAERVRIAAFPPKARAGLPFDGEHVIAARPLALDRLRAACGMVEREPD